MNIVTIKRSVAALTTQTAPVVVPLVLSGPFVLGVQVYTSDLLDTSLRLLSGRELVFPDPISASFASGVRDDGWYRPLATAMLDTRLVFSDRRGILELANADAATAADVIVNLVVAEQPPDRVTLEIMEGLKSELVRLPIALSKAVDEAGRLLVERLSIPR